MKVPILLPNIFNHPFTYESDINLKVGDYARKKLGKILTLNKLNLIENEIEDILVKQNSYSQEIDNFFEKYFY